MKQYLSPRELAEALAVSESSVKRWADEGHIAVTRTGGGHRRIALEEVVRFVRRSNASVSRPEILGFEETGHVPWQHLSEQELEAQVYEALVQGQSAKAFGLIHGPFLGGRPLAWIFDGPVRSAMHRLGELWKHQDDGILLEHRATDICVQAVMRIRLSLPVDSQAPGSVGGAGPGDPYLLPTFMAATVLRDVGMNDTNLGPRTPLAVFREAVGRFNPRLVWLSVSVEQAAEALRPELVKLSEDLSAHGASLVIGGQAVGKLADLRHPNLTIGHSMAELSTFARGLLASMRPRQEPLVQDRKGSS
jgi:excisionase family DNA binding protein